MKTLPLIRPTPEQLPLLSQNRFGVEIIKGAAGSGKTTTALLRLRSLTYMFEERRLREEDDRPVRVLVLTFNRTLKGYVTALANEQLREATSSTIYVDTFAHWAYHTLGKLDIVNNGHRESVIQGLSRGLPLSPSYVVNEVDYLQGKFHPDQLSDYLIRERTGRGLSPRVDQELRQRILNDVVTPYNAWKLSNGLVDWNDLAVMMMAAENQMFDIVIVDESQDFSANQLRAVRKHVSEDHAVTFVIDTAQRIYARGFTWPETGFEVRPQRYHTLAQNHRNTKQIAALAAGVLNNLPIDADGALPNLHAATREGDTPKLLVGLYPQQVDWCIDFIKHNVDLSRESVAFLKIAGGHYFSFLKSRLHGEGLRFAEISRAEEWPGDGINIALSTFHSAKGLEFDYVFIIGLSSVNSSSIESDIDDSNTVSRRLFAVAIARARDQVIVGCKMGEESFLIDYLHPDTYEEISL